VEIALGLCTFLPVLGWRSMKSLSKEHSVASGVPGLFPGVFAAVPHAITLVIHPDSVVLDASPSFSECLDTPMDSICGVRLAKLIPESDLAEWEPVLAEVRSTGAPIRRDLPLVGRRFDVWVSLVIAALNGDRLLSVVGWDVTDRRDSDLSQLRLDAASSKLRASLTAINACCDLPTALARLLQEALNFSAMDAGAAYLIEGGEAVLQCSLGLDPEFVQQIAHRRLDASFVQMGREHGKELLDLVERSPEYNPLRRRHGLQHVYGVFLGQQARPFGFLKLASRREMAPKASELEWVRILAMETEHLSLRFRSEADLRENESNFRRFFEAVDLSMVLSPEGRILSANQAILARLGYTAEELASMHVLQLHPPNTHAEAREIFGAMIRGERCQCPLPLIRKDGQLLPVETRVWRGVWNGAECIFGVVRDLTAEREAQQRFERLFRHNPALMAIASVPDRRFLDVNDAFVRTLGFSRDEVLGKSARELNLFELPEAQEAAFQRVKAGERIDGLELRVRCKDGSWRHGLFSGELIASQGKGFLLTVMIDNTQQHEAVLRLRESEEKLRLLGDNLPAGMVYQVIGRTDGSRRFVHVSAGVASVHGVTPEEVKNDASVLYRQVIEEDRGRLAAREEESFRTLEPFGMEFRIRRPDGSVRWVYARSATTSMPGGEIRWDGLELDVTEMKRLEEQLRQSQKMEGIGHLAGGLAHEFNNILAAMMMNLGMVNHGHIPIEAAETLREVQTLAQRAAELIKHLLAFSRRSVLHMQPVDLAAVAARQSSVLRRLLGERITLEFLSPAGLPWVDADPGMIEQAILNLCLNGRDAMPDGGKLSMELSVVEADRERVAPHEGVPPGTYLRLSVRDTGCGMDEEVKRRLFEPFFTTKDVGKGTGLGLATVRGIVQQHRGWVEVWSRPGEGSVFSLHLPVLPSPAENIPDAGSRAHAGTVLVVEDDPGIRRLTCKLLQLRDYNVLEARDASEALELWRRDGDSIDLVFSDLVLPGALSGLQMAERMLAEQPSLRVLLTSGYTSELPDMTKPSASPIAFIPKPCPPDLLLGLIQAILSPGRAA
jgi:PAS domain S-box-containing protein